MLFAASCILFIATGAHAQSLGAMMRETGFDRLIGTWGDQESNGERIKVTFAWRLKEHAVGVSAKMGERHSEALIGIDPRSGDVLHVGVDDNGGAISGKWSEEEGNAVLEIEMIQSDGEERAAKIVHKFVSADEIKVSMTNADNGEEASMTLVRLKPEKNAKADTESVGEKPAPPSPPSAPSAPGGLRVIEVN